MQNQTNTNGKKNYIWLIVIVVLGIILFCTLTKKTEPEVPNNNSFTNESQGLQNYYDSVVEEDKIEWTKVANEALYEQLCLTDPDCSGSISSSDNNPSNTNENASNGCPTGCTYQKSGCVIKGNISFDTNERIYHLPGMTFYENTVINADYGERWFCTESEAKANGWRKADN